MARQKQEMPHNIDAENAILGAVLAGDQPNLAHELITKLHADDFYDGFNQAVYKTIAKLVAENKPVDLVTVCDAAKDLSPSKIALLANSRAFPGQFDYYCDLVKEHSTRRKLIAFSLLSQELARKDDDIDNILARIEKSFFDITKDESVDWEMNLQLMVRHQKTLEERYHHKGETHGVKTGFVDLDKMTGGWRPGQLIFIGAVPKMGKCLGKGTKVLMYDGTIKNVEDVVVGDKLMGPDSKPRTVLSLARGREQMYWIRQSYGVDYRVNESHILSLKKSKGYTGPSTPGKVGDVFNLSVKDYLNSSKRFKIGYKGYKVAVEFPEKDVPIDPYFLGLWLGDGDSKSSKVTNTDKEIVDYLNNYALKNNLKLMRFDSNGTRATTFHLSSGRAQEDRDNSIQAKLRKLGVLKNKHIPEIYLINSKENRLKLLAGLIDSDGYYLRCHNKTGSGPYEITMRNYRLVKQIKFLCDSLGYRTSIRKKVATINERSYTTNVYRLRFNGNVDEIPVLVQRKKANKWTRKDNWTLSRIRVEKDIVDDYYGFELDGDGLFLLEDMTVTHNTSIALHFALHSKVPTLFFTLEMLPDEIADRQVSAKSMVEGDRIKNGNFEHEHWQKVTGAARELAKLPIGWVKKSGMTVTEIRAVCRRFQAEHGLGLVVIDQLDKIYEPRQKGELKTDAIGRVTSQLKNMARDLEVPVIVLLQLLDKQITKRNSPRPTFGDIRDSSCPDQDGDVILFLWRPEFYWPDKTKLKNKAEIIVSRQRSGKTGSVWVNWHPDYTAFTSMAKEYWPKEEDLK